MDILNAAEFKPVTISGMDNHTGAGDLPRFQLGGFGWQIWHRALPATTAHK